MWLLMHWSYQNGGEKNLEVEFIVNQNHCTKCFHQCIQAAERESRLPDSPFACPADGYWKEEENRVLLRAKTRAQNKEKRTRRLSVDSQRRKGKEEKSTERIPEVLLCVTESLRKPKTLQRNKEIPFGEENIFLQWKGRERLEAKCGSQRKTNLNQWEEREAPVCTVFCPFYFHVLKSNVKSHSFKKSKDLAQAHSPCTPHVVLTSLLPGPPKTLSPLFKLEGRSRSLKKIITLLVL